jgi:hypothetical protein
MNGFLQFCSQLLDKIPATFWGVVVGSFFTLLGTKNVKSPFLGFRFHDLRHQAITELAESKASDQTIMGIAGHVSKKMLQHYSHVRMEAKRNALDALSMKPAQSVDSGDTTRGYDTNNDTKPKREMEGVPQVVDFMVELSGIEPLASSLRTRRSPS